MPTHDVFEVAESGELVLGGYCVSDADPKRRCKECGQNFGEKMLLRSSEIISFEFFVGGYFGTSHFDYIDGKRKNKLIRYAKLSKDI